MHLYALPVSVWCNFCSRICEVRWDKQGYTSCPGCGKVLAQILPQDVGAFREEYERIKGLFLSHAAGAGRGPIIQGKQDSQNSLSLSPFDSSAITNHGYAMQL